MLRRRNTEAEEETTQLRRQGKGSVKDKITRGRIIEAFTNIKEQKKTVIIRVKREKYEVNTNKSHDRD